MFAPNFTIKSLMSLPGVGFILAVVIYSEIGDVERFGSASRFASYSRTTPRIHARGGKVHYGPLRSDVNRYIKWAFAEAANVNAVNRRRWPGRHVSRLYEHLRGRKGHQTAIGAVARHVAESTYWMLKRQEEYREPKRARFRPRGDKRGLFHELFEARIADCDISSGHDHAAMTAKI